MKKILSIEELKNSNWPKRIEDAFKENLISAFVHGNCLMEGFSALESPWTIALILKSNSTSDIAPLQNLAKQAKRENIEFSYIFSRYEIASLKDEFPLEFLHISNRNEKILGEIPLQDFSPNPEQLRKECSRELRGLLMHCRHELIYILQGINPYLFFSRTNSALLPILYGIYSLIYHKYPDHHETIYEAFPGIRIPQTTKDSQKITNNISNYIESIVAIANQIDSIRF